MIEKYAFSGLEKCFGDDKTRASLSAAVDAVAQEENGGPPVGSAIVACVLCLRPIEM